MSFLLCLFFFNLPVVTDKDSLVDVHLIQKFDQVLGEVLGGIGSDLKANTLGLVLNAIFTHQFM
jgi:hypothetical protein